MRIRSALLLLTFVSSALAAPQKPGCAVGISRDGKVIATRVNGMANLEHDIPIAADTIFEAGSVSKQFTAASLVLLEQQGKLSLDDEVRKYIPELPEYANGVTIRQMLSHTAGLRDWGTVVDIAGWPRGTRSYTHEFALDVLTKQRALNFPPGSQYSYSNSGYTLAAIVVERVSGKTLPQFTRQAFFIPLGMTHSSWRDDYARIVKKRATAYSLDDGVYRADMHFENIWGNCCLLTTVGDLLRWNDTLNSSPLATAMETPTLLTSGRAIEYGLGLTSRTWRGTPEVSHSGATGGYRSWLARYPERRFSVAVLCNDGSANATSIGRNAVNEFIKLPETKITPVPLTAEQLSSRVGLYRNPRTDAILPVFVKEGKMRVGFSSGTELVPLSVDRFRIGEGSGELTFNDSKVQLSNFQYEFLYERVPMATDVTLADYAGDYWSEEAGALYELRATAKGLVIRIPPSAEKYTAVPTYADGFRIGSTLLRFTRDPSGKLDGFDLKHDADTFAGTARVERIHFVRR